MHSMPENFLGPTVIAILFALCMAFTLSRIIRRSGGRVGTFEHARSEMKVKEDLDELLLQIQQISNEQIAKLDSKIRMLNQLVIDAEQKRKELEALVHGGAKPGPAPEPPRAERPANPLHEQVYGLHDQGRSAAEIGAATGLEKGEIELILGLRHVR